MGHQSLARWGDLTKISDLGPIIKSSPPRLANRALSFVFEILIPRESIKNKSTKSTKLEKKKFTLCEHSLLVQDHCHLLEVLNGLVPHLGIHSLFSHSSRRSSLLNSHNAQPNLWPGRVWGLPVGPGHSCPIHSSFTPPACWFSPKACLFLLWVLYLTSLIPGGFLWSYPSGSLCYSLLNSAQISLLLNTALVHARVVILSKNDALSWFCVHCFLAYL